MQRGSCGVAAAGGRLAADLDPSGVPRGDRWRRSLQLCREAPLGPIAELAAAEQSCCSFFAFALTIDGRGAALKVRAPAEGLVLVDALFGGQGGERYTKAAANAACNAVAGTPVDEVMAGVGADVAAKSRAVP